MVAVQGLDGVGLVFIIDRGRGAVGVEILGSHPVQERRPLGQDAMASRGPSISGLTISLLSDVYAVAGDFGQDLGAAGFGVFVGFEDQNACAFSQNRAVALLGEGEAAFGREDVEAPARLS